MRQISKSFRETAMREAIASLTWFGAAILIVNGGLALIFMGDLLTAFRILFYRGLAAIAISAVAAFFILNMARRIWRRWLLRDVISATLCASGLTVCFFVVLPVTVDRSVTVFILGQMAARPNYPFTAEEMQKIFIRQYLGEHRQIERRLQEQSASGNLTRTNSGYQISLQGAKFIRLAHFISEIFGTEPWIIDASPGPALPAEQQSDDAILR
jgi:hypothetical protein